MDCYKVKEKLSAFLDRTLPVEEIRDLETHLKSCPECSVELRSLKQIDLLVQKDLFPLPDDDYWTVTPKIILKHLGLRPKTSMTERFFYASKALFPSPNLRWAIAGAVAAFALVFSIKTFYPTKPEFAEIDVGNEKISKSLEMDDEITAAEDNSAKEKSEDKIAEKQFESGFNSEEHTDRNTIYENVTLLADAPGQMNKIKPHPLRKRISKGLRFEQELIPLPNSEFLPPITIADAEASSNEPLVQTFARDRKLRQIPSAPKSGNPDTPAEKTESSFAETMWIVQESPSLIEKKNIWLSYISRETDPTYRSMGIYNLALVLAKIAEGTNDPEKAKEALQFFKENEKSLRFQMSDNRYELKMNALYMIINQ